MPDPIKLTTLDATASHPEQIAVLERDGAVILRDALAPELLAQLNSELDSELAACQPGSRSDGKLWQIFHGRNTKRLGGLTRRCPSFIHALAHPSLLATSDHFLLPNCGSYWLNTSQMMEVGPGEPAQILHRDNGNWPHFPWPNYEITVSSMFALNDFTAENGATWVVPGSHLWEDEMRQPALKEIAIAEMSAGSMLIYTGNAIHGAGENSSVDQWRRGMHVSFVLGWLRPEEHHQLAVPLEVAKTLPEEVRQLLGYATYHPSVPGGRLGLLDFQEVDL